MKRNKIVALAVVVMMMVGAVVLMSCSKCPGDGDCKLDSADVLGSFKSWCFDVNMDDEGDAGWVQKAQDCFGSVGASGTYTCQC